MIRQETLILVHGNMSNFNSNHIYWNSTRYLSPIEGQTAIIKKDEPLTFMNQQGILLRLHDNTSQPITTIAFSLPHLYHRVRVCRARLFPTCVSPQWWAWRGWH